MTWVVLVLVLGLAFSNGANDNFKGVATLHGAGSASYRRALTWATLTTLAGSLLSLTLAAGLIRAFSGTGLVPKDLASSPAFLAAVASAAVLTVLAATRLGLPVSTTHALTGALVGAGLVAVGGAVDFAKLGRTFLLPLALSPVAAIALTATVYPLAAALSRAAGITRETCVCVGNEWLPLADTGVLALPISGQLTATTGTMGQCRERYHGALVGISAQTGLDVAHFLSAGAVSFARGLNDTPKIVALILAAKATGTGLGIPLVAVAIAGGGAVGARRVARTMSHELTELTPGSGLVANAAAAVLVIAASRYGLPVSTTHVTTGGLFGIGAVTRQARRQTIAKIALAWLTTLPLAVALGAVAYLAL